MRELRQAHSGGNRFAQIARDRHLIQPAADRRVKTPGILQPGDRSWIVRSQSQCFTKKWIAGIMPARAITVQEKSGLPRIHGKRFRRNLRKNKPVNQQGLDPFPGLIESSSVMQVRAK
ncbi:MAG TPA: hypothetical protein VGM64_06395 [Lacunisphaera sp.]